MLEKQKIRGIRNLDAYKLSICHPYSGGINIGSREIYVALPPEIAAELDIPIVYTFSTYTKGLKECLDLLIHCGIRTVSMESTSVYWKNLYDILEEGGLEVCLVNPKKFRIVPGRKTDILDCQWLQTLHMYGLLSGSFIPQAHIRELRSYMRERDKLLKDRTRYVQRMQKAMVEMNLMLANVLDNITGKTGMAIINAILAGQHDPSILAKLRNGHVKKSEEEIALALEGDYKEEQLFLLQANYEAYLFFTSQLGKLDQRIAELLKTFPAQPLKVFPEKEEKNEKKMEEKYKQRGKNDLRTKENMEEILIRITGTDLTSITGLQANSILQIIAEIGTDISKFPTAKHFASYLGFTPHNKITGGIIISSRTDRVKSHAAQAFKKVVPAISKGKSALAAFYQRVAGKAGTGKAIVAVCRKRAIIFYNTMTMESPFIEEGRERDIEKMKIREKMILKKLAKKYNMSLADNG